MAKNISSVSLFFKEGVSDKEYHIQLVEVSANRYTVNFQYGRRGSALQSGTKTPSPLPLTPAQNIYDNLKREKINKGYQVVGTTKSPKAGMPPKQSVITHVPQLLNTIELEEVDDLIDDDNYIAQEKMDGERRMAFVNVETSGSFGINKKGKQTDLPDDVKDSIHTSCVLDGELIGDVLYAFDIIGLNGKDLKNTPCIDRLSQFDTMSFGDGVKVVPTAYTKLEKRKLFDRLKREGKEGIVFKNKNGFYTGGRPNSGGNQLKYKFTNTATFKVENITKDKRSVGLIVYHGVKKISIGKVTIPPNHKMPEVGDYVEVRYLYAYKDGAIYQPVYLGKRTDCDDTDISKSQIVYKPE